MVVLSLFDGISCGMLALQKNGIKVDKYYASEIDKYAIKISKKNYSGIIQLGDISNWKTWDIETPDIIIGGSPCQGFSFAGKQLNFEDERSKLFFKFVDIKNYYNPKYFLFENVKMKKEYQDIIGKSLGVNAIEINSSLVSAQSRKRLYWTNIPMPSVKQPQDKKIYLKDILTSGTVDRDKSYCIDANYFKGGNLKNYFQKSRRQLVFEKSERNGKSVLLLALGGGQGAKTGLYSIPQIGENIVVRKLTPIECERLQNLPDDYTKGISNTQRYKCLGNAWTVDVISHILGYQIKLKGD